MPKEKNTMDDIQKLILSELKIVREKVEKMDDKFVTKDTFWRVSGTVIAAIVGIFSKLIGWWK